MPAGRKTHALINAFRMQEQGNPTDSSNYFVYGNIDIIIRYRPKFLFWEETVSQRFSSRKNIKGELEWLPIESQN